MAQSSEAPTDILCKAPVALDDKACADVLGSAAARQAQGTIVQRDDGYYVIVPRRAD